MTAYTDQARLRAEIAEPAHGRAPLVRLAETVARVTRVAAHYGLPAEHAEALVVPHASAAWRAKLAADTAIFEAMGGRVEHVAPGVSGWPEPEEGAPHVWTRLDVTRPDYG